MKRNIIVVAIALQVQTAPLASAAPLGTAFTYQGVLRQGGSPLNDTADFQFRLFDAVTGGTAVSFIASANNVSVVDGLFTVSIDFVSPVFTGDARWMEISVRSPAATGTYATLSPRQPLTAAPYALYALSGPGSGGPWAVSGNNIYNTNTGKVGIGTSIPGAVITNSKMDVIGGHIAVSNNFGLFSMNSAGNNIGAGIDTTPADDLSFFSAGAERMRLTSIGRVGIGTTNPLAKMHIFDPATGEGIRIQGGSSGVDNLA